MEIRFIREGDGKTFEVNNSGHWTEIIAEDGEIDTVEWFSQHSEVDLYVSNSGHIYHKVVL